MLKSLFIKAASIASAVALTIIETKPLAVLAVGSTWIAYIALMTAIAAWAIRTVIGARQ